MPIQGEEWAAVTQTCRCLHTYTRGGGNDNNIAGRENKNQRAPPKTAPTVYEASLASDTYFSSDSRSQSSSSWLSWEISITLVSTASE